MTGSGSYSVGQVLVAVIAVVVIIIAIKEDVAEFYDEMGDGGEFCSIVVSVHRVKRRRKLTHVMLQRLTCMQLSMIKWQMWCLTLIAILYNSPPDNESFKCDAEYGLFHHYLSILYALERSARKVAFHICSIYTCKKAITRYKLIKYLLFFASNKRAWSSNTVICTFGIFSWSPIKPRGFEHCMFWFPKKWIEYEIIKDIFNWALFHIP